MVGKNFFSSIIFAPEKKLLGDKVEKTMDNYYGYNPGTTKIIKPKLIPDLDLDDVGDKITRFPVGTNIFKIFNDVEYKRLGTGYESKNSIKFCMKMGMQEISIIMK